MARRKLQKFREFSSSSYSIEHTDDDAKDALGKFIGKKDKVILELACGHGEYTIALASKYPDKKFIGIDKQGERLWFGMKKAEEKKLDNLRFLRIQIEQLLDYIPKKSIDEIWITFPGPFPKKGSEGRRLTNPRFLQIYKKILKPKAFLHLKTDDLDFFKYSIGSIIGEKGKILDKAENIHSMPNIPEILSISTYFERKHIENNKEIFYLKCVFRDEETLVL